MCLILALAPSIPVSTNKCYLIFSLLVCLKSASPATLELQLCLSKAIQNGVISAQGVPIREDSWISSSTYVSLLPQPGTGRWIGFHRILTHWPVCEITDQRHWLIGCKDHLTASEEDVLQHCAFARGWFYDLSGEMSIRCSQSPKTFTSIATLPMFRLKQCEMQNKISLTLQ